MPTLTQREMFWVENQLKLEQAMVKKYKFCYQLCSDPQLKIKCEEIAAKHIDHYTKLLDMIR